MEPQAQLLITLMVDGTVQVSGPIDNKLLCYGLLGCAQDAIREYKAKQTTNIISLPQMGMTQ